jgi:hypothetical protein
VTVIRVGVPWLSEQDWPKWTAIDPEMLPYDVWRAKADAAIVELESRGITPVVIDVGPGEFAEWCRVAGKLSDKHSRCEYAAVRLRGRSDTADSSNHALFYSGQSSLDCAP